MLAPRLRQRVDETPIAHIALSVCPGVPLAEIQMALLTAYYDAAGDNAGADAVTVGGFIGDVRSWGRFTPRWREALDRHGIDQFHMTDFVAGGKGFERFRGRPDLQSEVLSDLIPIVRKNVRMSPATTVLLDDWRAANKDYWLKECRLTPYAIGALSAISKSITWIATPNKRVRPHKHHTITEFIFEHGDTGQGDFKWIMDHAIRAGRGYLDSVYPIFKPKTLLPLQCCDFAAWEQRTAVRRHIIDKTDTELRQSLQDLLVIPQRWGVIDRAKIVDWAVLLGVPKRSEPLDRRRWKPAFQVLPRRGLA